MLYLRYVYLLASRTLQCSPVLARKQRLTEMVSAFNMAFIYDVRVGSYHGSCKFLEPDNIVY